MTTKRILVVAGPNGSGKSSVVTSTDLHIIENKIINPDNYVRGMADIQDEVTKYQIAMDICQALREDLLQRGLSFGFETVASRQDKLDFLKRAKSEGYEITLLFVTAGSPEKCCERIAQRVKAGGHDVPKEKVFARFERTMRYLPQYLELVDRAEVFDNSGDNMVKVLSKIDGKYIPNEKAKDMGWVQQYLWDYFSE